MKSFVGVEPRHTTVSMKRATGDSGCTAFLDELAYAAAIVSLDARLVHANRAARRELALGNTVAVSDAGAVRAWCVAADRELQVAIRRAAQGRRTLVRLRASDDRRTWVSVLPLKQGGDGGWCCALLFSRAALCDGLMLGYFARHHALTPTEEAVVSALCEGLSTPQAAARMLVAVSTVRSHVRNICRKTRCRGVRQLLQEVALLPATAPAPLTLPFH